jgi:uncharacterized damage-inducible protein DinB
MDALQLLRQSFAHTAWADAKLFAALRENPQSAAAWREYDHVLGAAAVWLARLERRPASVGVWPALNKDEADALREELSKGYERFLNRLSPDALSGLVEYTNSAGQTFRTAIADILLHVALHGQYHRGKINLLLRQDGAEPEPADYIGFVRGVPAAVTPVLPSKLALDKQRQ